MPARTNAAGNGPRHGFIWGVVDPFDRVVLRVSHLGEASMSKSDSCEPIILLIEDDSNLRERLATALRLHGCRVHAAADLTEAVRATNIYAFDYAVVEPKSSESLLRRLRQSSPELNILVFTGYRRAASQVMRDLGVHFLQKPADADDVLCALGLVFDTADAPSCGTNSPPPS